MATKIYDRDTILLMDDREIEISPLKIKYLREFLDAFEFVKTATSEDEAIFFLSECARISMKQYCPELSKSHMDLEDNVDLDSIYKIIDIAAGIKVKPDAEESIKKQATDSGSSWDTLDLASLEAEVFLIGIWKDYEELELCLSMPELIATLERKRDLDYQDKKFQASIQGVDLDKNNSNTTNAWEDMKARVFSGGQAKDANDIVGLQGINAQKAGFGIGMGLEYEKIPAKK
jgi:hypothetical protein